MATVSDFIIDRLIEWDLHRFYGFPGDGIGGFDGALERAERAGKDFRYIRPDPRGDGLADGVRARQVHRRGRGVHRRRRARARST